LRRVVRQKAVADAELLQARKERRGAGKKRVPGVDRAVHVERDMTDGTERSVAGGRLGQRAHAALSSRPYPWARAGQASAKVRMLSAAIPIRAPKAGPQPNDSATSPSPQPDRMVLR